MGGPASFHEDAASRRFPPAAVPTEPVGIGLRHPHYEAVLETGLDPGWLEVHPENYFGGGINRYHLGRAREKFQISLHGVGLSLGSDQPPREEHLRALKELTEIYQPFSVSEHASWSASGNAHLGDLLPLPYTRETLERLAGNVGATQDYLGRRLLIENPSTYLSFADDEMTEAAFMNRLAETTGCGILLDINNIYVQAHNHGYGPDSYIETIEKRHVGEMHLAGHTAAQGADLLIDTHNRPVRDEVWALYERAARRFGPVPTLIEWDRDIPPLETLIAEAEKAREILRRVCGVLSHAAA